MRWLDFRKCKGIVWFYGILFFFSFLYVPIYSQEKEVKINSRHKLEIYWEKLLPSYGKIQYAGSMGFVSLGIGWDYGKHEQWETDLFLGYIPHSGSVESHHTFTIKENYIPWRCSIFSDRLYLEPLETGFYFSRIFGDEFWYKSPSKYPTGYYALATNLRFNIFLGQRFSFLVDRDKKRWMTFFYEVSTNDLYLIDKFTNSCLKMKDIISLSLGLKYKFL